MDRRGKCWRPVLLIAAVVAAAGSLGCTRRDAPLEQEALATEHLRRMEALGELEVRLVAVAARQRAWAELQERHSRISAIACENVAKHVSAMQRHDERQREKRALLRSARLAKAQTRAEAKHADHAPAETAANN